MVRASSPSRSVAVAPLDYALSERAVTWGNRAGLLIGGGDAFAAMLTAIDGAQREVLLESYIVEDDRIGNSFREALCRAAARGVDVRFLCDGFGSIGLPESWFASIAAAGGRSVVYHPVRFWKRPLGLMRRDHRKILVVDRAIGFTGGLNLADDYDDLAEAGHIWRDLHVRIEGPAARQLAALFAATWNHSCKAGEFMAWRPPIEAVFGNVERRGVAIEIVSNQETRHRSRIRRTFLRAAARARRTLCIANAYFLPDRAIVNALLRAVERGVDVRVVVPARSDIRLVDLAARAIFPRLLAGGVRIAEWSLGMMHAKAVAVDGQWATVGSYNFDRRSLHYNLEVTANIFDETFAAALATHILADFERSRELHADTLHGSLWQRLASRFAYLLRAWL